MEYRLIDSGEGQKLEQFGPYRLIRPSSQAVWRPSLGKEEWDKADATFTREPSNTWKMKKKLPPSWTITHHGITFKVAPTDFGHLGLFPEHATLWKWMKGRIRKGSRVLNLFAYSGGASFAAAQAGASVCHLDASKASVAWARENAELNKLEKAPIRWIIDDVVKFLKRELRREACYDGIILDPPTFGRGSQGESFKIERDLDEILSLCRSLLTQGEEPFMILSAHTPGYTPLVMHHLLSQKMSERKGVVESGELVIPGPLDLPSGTYARWYGAH